MPLQNDPQAQLSEASTLVQAVADLLRVASDQSQSNIAEALSNDTLKTLATKIHSEALAIEILYSQLREVHSNSQAALIQLFHEQPQVSIPLSKMTLSQLQEVQHSATNRQETIAANLETASRTSENSLYNQLMQLQEYLASEINRRHEQQP